MDLNIAKERINSVVRPDSINTSHNDFMLTHVKLSNLCKFDKFESNPTIHDVYSEDELYRDLVLNPNNEHRFVVVYGQSGTGKSHLIRWFDEKMKYDKTDDEVVLFVSRNDNTLKGTIKQLLNKNEIKEMINNETYKRLLSSSEPLEDNKLKNLLYYKFITEVENDDINYNGILSRIDKKKLPIFLKDEVIQKKMLEDDGPINRIFSKIAEKDIMVDRDVVAEFTKDDFVFDNDLYDEMEDHGSAEKAKQFFKKLESILDFEESYPEKTARYLNKFVSSVIQNSIGIQSTDFQTMFMEIREALAKQNKNLTLFIEDITSFTGVDEALLNALMVEHTGMYSERNFCRITSIVGTTKAYFEDKFRDNHKDRVTKYIYIPDNVFDDNQLFEFVGKYLNAMSLDESDIDKWVVNGAKDYEYPVHVVKEGSYWDVVRIKNDVELPLYPFSKNAIINLYKNSLNNNQRTPRYIIKNIIEPVVREIINIPEKFPTKRFDNPGLNIPLYQRLEQSYNDKEVVERLFTFMDVWGDGSFEKTIIDEYEYLASINVKVFEELKLPVLTGTPSIKIIKKPEDSDGQKIDNNTIKQGEVSKENQEKYKKVLTALNEWKDGKNLEIIATGGTTGIIKKALDKLQNTLISSISWQVEGVSVDNALRVKNETSIILEGQNTTKSGYILNRNMDNYYILNIFSKYVVLGNNSWNYPDFEYDLYFVNIWQEKNKESYINYVKTTKSGIKSCYAEAALILDTYYMILNGLYTSSSLTDLKIEHYVKLDYSKSIESKSSHTKEWKELINFYDRYEDKKNRGNNVSIKAFNIAQGDSLGNRIVIDYRLANMMIDKICNNKLKLENINSQLNDKVNSRKEIIELYNKIDSNITKVVVAEKNSVKKDYEIISKFFDVKALNKEVFNDKVKMLKEFYDSAKAININLINPFPSVQAINVEKTINSINAVKKCLDEPDDLKSLLYFSIDPKKELSVLAEIVRKIEDHVIKVENEVNEMNKSLNIKRDDDTSLYKTIDEALCEIENDLNGENVKC